MFVAISDQVKKLGCELSKLRETSGSLENKMEADVSVLREQLAEALSRDEIHLVTINNLTDKLKILQVRILLQSCCDFEFFQNYF